MKSERYDRIAIPDDLAKRIRDGIRQGEKIYVCNKRRKVLLRAASVAAVLLVCVGVFASQPALAAKIPVICNIFKFLQEDYSYQGDLDSVAQKFEESENRDTGSQIGAERAEEQNSGSATGDGGTQESAGEKDSRAADSDYTKTVDGVTVSISEAYCSVEAIYLSLMITSDAPFEPTMVNVDGQSVVYLKGTADYSFRPQGMGEAEGYANGGTGSLEGKFIDGHTYAGIYRIDILDMVGNNDTLKEKYRLLDAFDMNFTIDQIIGDKAEPEPLDYRGKTEEELAAMSDEEWRAFMDEITPPDRNQFPNKYENWWFDGPFAFALHIEKDNESAKVVTVDEINESGAGLHQVVKTKFEITVEEKCTEERAVRGVFNVVLDADGKLLPNGSSSYADTFAIGGRDVSKVYVYVCDYAEYMDEIKGYRNDVNFKEILDKRALYGKEIVF
ncbi:MAG: DUF4179 domain-containing protein [Eubacterium sp.]|nr:DUF4179 domain-containing protein [Eubacterium sp.]